MKVISATTKVILTTNKLMSAHKSDLGHKKLILSTEEAITFTFKLILVDTKVILATNNFMSVPKKVIPATTKVILTTNNLISARESDLCHKKTYFVY